MSKKKSNGKAYERLVATIYERIHATTGAVVTRDDHLPSKAGGARQIDVSIRHKLAGDREYLIIVSVKHFKRPASLGPLDELRAVMHDVGAQKGILVCSSAFTRSVVRHGKFYGIDCCVASDLEVHPWDKDVSIPFLWLEYHHNFAARLLSATKEQGKKTFNLKDGLMLYNNKWVDVLELYCLLWNNGELSKDPRRPQHLTLPIQQVRCGSEVELIKGFEIQQKRVATWRMMRLSPEEYNRLEHFTSKQLIEYFKLDVPIVNGHMPIDNRWKEINADVADALMPNGLVIKVTTNDQPKRDKIAAVDIFAPQA